MSPPGYQATVVKASRCGNERPERSDRRKAGSRELAKKPVAGKKLLSTGLSLSGSRLRKFQMWTERHIGFLPVLFFGRGVFQYNYGFVPYRKAINVVVGKPIR